MGELLPIEVVRRQRISMVVRLLLTSACTFQQSAPRRTKAIPPPNSSHRSNRPYALMLPAFPLCSSRMMLALSSCSFRRAGAMRLNLITEAWLVNERTGGDWMRIGVRIGNECSTELTTDAALAELALAAGSTIEDVMNAMLAAA